MSNKYKPVILAAIEKSGKRPLFSREFAKLCKVKSDFAALKDALAELVEEGVLVPTKGHYVSAKALKLFPAKVDRISKTFGFIKRMDDQTDVFIPGKFLQGAMPEDTVLAKLIPPRGSSPEGEVVSILRQGPARFSGVMIEQDGRFCVLPDNFAKFSIPLVKGGRGGAKLGDKVLAEVSVRGERHSEHMARVVSVYGSADRASVCAAAILDASGVSPEFSEQAMEEARYLSQQGIQPEDLNRRLDLRDKPIFTIDGADSMDLDDAISLEREGDGYLLGVHIADVSHYVRYNSALDKEAFERGTSVYYANKVVPMLPKELSNGICSLNPNEDRLTFSALMHVDKGGKLGDFEFKKSIIRSRVKGVYTEINAILSETKTPDDLLQKYAEVADVIPLMQELADKLTRNKLSRGAPQIDTAESKVIVDENDVTVDIKPRTRGQSEVLIEEFMLMANEAAATLARQQEIPFVYRVHENPSPERVATLHETIVRLGLNMPTKDKQGATSPAHLSAILDKARGMEIYPVVNKLVLRSMAKAKYASEPLGHFGLVLEDYAHFTSPIRRYPDLSIHRILTDFVNGMEKGRIQKRYAAFVTAASQKSTDAELTAMRCERDCEDCYKAEYMHAHLGEEFPGIISSAAEHGLYVELENTVEGLVRIDSLPEGQYEFDGLFEYKEVLSGKRYRVGNAVHVKCVGADVSLGRIDFVIV